MNPSTPQPSPLVSVIMPVYNGERFLAGAIQNVLEQDYGAVEIVVVDDGSTDSTPAIAARFAGAIRYVRRSRGGPAAARNLGIETARGEVITFLDVDDQWPQGKLRRQVGYLLAHPGVDIVQGLIVQMRLDRSVPGPAMVFEECSEPYQFINLGSAVFRRSVFERVGLFDESLYESDDTDWFFRAWERGVAKVVQDQVALYYRQHGDNLTAGVLHPNLRIVKVLKRHLDRNRERGFSAGSVAGDLPNVAAYIGSPPVEMHKARLKDERFTIISNDCWGSGPYGHASLMYRTPFIGTRIWAADYVALLKNLKGYLASSLEFIQVSSYGFMNKQRADSLGFYPIALLGGDVEVHFIHETDPAVAAGKWQRRLGKMHPDNLFVKFSQDPEVCSDALLEDFDSLDYPYKVCFTYRDYPQLRSTITIADYFVAGAPMYHLSRKYFDAVSWLNKVHGPHTQAYRLPAAIHAS